MEKRKRKRENLQGSYGSEKNAENGKGQRRVQIDNGEMREKKEV